MDRYLTEFIGTFFLVLAVGFSVVSGSSLGPLAIGGTLVTMVYMGGHVSGGHYNPAISLGVYLHGELDRRDLVPYMVAQFLGAIAAALAVRTVTGQVFVPAPGPGVGVFATLLSETLFTFALVLVVLNVAVHPATRGNDYYGLAIGLVVMVGALTVGPISGGAFNPAVGVGPALAGMLGGLGALSHAWLYLVGPFLGGALAVPVFRIQLDG